jgi:hypothetical protein
VVHVFGKMNIDFLEISNENLQGCAIVPVGIDLDLAK